MGCLIGLIMGYITKIISQVTVSRCLLADDRRQLSQFIVMCFALFSFLLYHAVSIFLLFILRIMRIRITISKIVAAITIKRPNGIKSK